MIKIYILSDSFFNIHRFSFLNDKILFRINTCKYIE